MCDSVVSEPNLAHLAQDGYTSAPNYGHHPPDYEVIGRYRFAIKLRQPVNAPGVLRNDFVGQLLNRWNAPSTIWWARSQGTQYPLTGGPVKQPLPSYSATTMMTEAPPQNRAAFSAAVQRFLATRGNRAA
jgi:hypothetical protein